MVVFLASPGSPQGLLLAVRSGISPGRSFGTIWDAWVEPGLAATYTKKIVSHDSKKSSVEAHACSRVRVRSDRVSPAPGAVLTQCCLQKKVLGTDSCSDSCLVSKTPPQANAALGERWEAFLYPT